MDVVAVTKCWYQWIHFCSVLVQRSSSTDFNLTRNLENLKNPSSQDEPLSRRVLVLPRRTRDPNSKDKLSESSTHGQLW